MALIGKLCPASMFGRACLVLGKLEQIIYLHYMGRVGLRVIRVPLMSLTFHIKLKRYENMFC